MNRFSATGNQDEESTGEDAVTGVGDSTEPAQQVANDSSMAMAANGHAGAEDFAAGEGDANPAATANGSLETPTQQGADAEDRLAGATESVLAAAGPDVEEQLEPVASAEQAPDAAVDETETAHQAAPVMEGAPEGIVQGVEGQVGAPTAPLPVSAEREELSPLPVNAVVGGKYVVQLQLHHGLDRNLYRVAARRQQRCGVCGRLSSVDAETCEECGSPLDRQPPADFYLMAESFRPDSLMQDPGVMDLNLYHPNLVPVIDFFSYKPFGHMRYYAIAEPRQGVRLSQLSMPRPGGQVLNWGMQLADALDYLHSRGVVGAGAEADDILVQGEVASLASLQNARSDVNDEHERAHQQTMDLARLAGTIYEAYTGHSPSLTPEGSLPMPSAAPEPVGAAFRAAIEPVQGAAPPISAAQWRDLLAVALDAVTELERPGRPVSFISSGLTDVGRLREQNQDSFGMSEFVQASVERPVRIGLYVVADGLGGHKGGEIASAIAVQTFTGEVIGRLIAPLALGAADRSTPTNEAILQGMTRAVQSANDRIYRARDSRLNDMGTTLVAVLVAGGKAYIVNVGDSRLYIYTKQQDTEELVPVTTSPLPAGSRVKGATTPLKGTNVLEPLPQPEETHDEINRADYTLNQVSIDHSLVHRLVELGQLDPEEAKVHPHRNFIYRSLGGPPPIEVDTFVHPLFPGDRILLCSDGLNSMIEDSAVEEVLGSEPEPQTAAQRLIDLANEAGGHDNITVVLVDIIDYLPQPEHPFALNNT